MYNFHMKIKNLTAKYNTHKGGAHASAKDYDRQQLKQELKQMTDESKAPEFTKSNAWSDLSNNQRGPHCDIDLCDSTDNYINITGIQLELGVHATDFEHVPYHDELQRCKRYYQKYNSLTCGYGSANGYARSTHILSPEMRATPSQTVTIEPGEAGSLNSSYCDSKHLEVPWQSLSGVQTGDFDAILEAEI